MKGRFRKGKKAYRAGLRPKLEGRYQRWIIKKELYKKHSARAVVACVTGALAMVQAQSIISAPVPITKDPKEVAREKAMKIVELAIESAEAIVRSYQSI
jgi:hypothetical protein